MKAMQLDMFGPGPLYPQAPAHIAEAKIPAPESRGNSITSPAAIFDRLISPTVSCGTIANEGRLRGTFKHCGAPWVATSARYHGEKQSCECYRVVDPTSDGLPHDRWDWDKARGRDLGGYHLMIVKHGGRDVMLLGPPMRVDRQA